MDGEIFPENQKKKKTVKTKISEKVRINKNTINQENGQDKTLITVAKIIPKWGKRKENTRKRMTERGKGMASWRASVVPGARIHSRVAEPAGENDRRNRVRFVSLRLITEESLLAPVVSLRRTKKASTSGKFTTRKDSGI